MSPKKKTSMFLEESVQNRLSILAARFNKGQSDIIEGLLDFAECLPMHFKGSDSEAFVINYLNTCMLKAGGHGRAWGWESDKHEELKEQFSRLRDLARAAGDEGTAKQAEAKLEQLYRDFPEEK